MADSFAEVQEALRQEKMARIWKKYGRYMIGFVVAIILFTALSSIHKAWDTSISTKQTNQVLDLIESADFPENINPDDLKLRQSLKSMVLLQAAAHHLENGDKETAKTFYSDVAEQSGGQSYYKSLALLMLSRLSTDENPHDILKPIIKQKNNIWRPHALLEVALYEATTNTDLGKAQGYLNTIINTESAPKSLKEQAKALSRLYALQASQAPTEE